MSTVRIYKVAELLGTTSQEVMDLLRRNHGIEVKSASSTIEEVVARQFVERLARQRNVALPSPTQMFVETGAPKGKKAGRAPEPPPIAPKLGPPRLVKTAKPAAAPDAEESAFSETELSPEPPAPVFEQPETALAPASLAPRLTKPREPTLRIEEPGAPVRPSELPAEATTDRSPRARAKRPGSPDAAREATAPASPLTLRKAPMPAEAHPEAPAAAAPQAPEQAQPAETGAREPSGPSAAPPPAAETPAAAPAAAPSAVAEKPRMPPPPLPRRAVVPPPTGRVVPPSIRLRVEEPAAQPRPSAPAAPARTTPGQPAAARGPAAPPATRPLPGGPRPLPSQPIRSPLSTARPSYQPTARPAPPPVRHTPNYGRPRPGGHRMRGRHSARPAAPAAPAAPPPITRTVTLAEGMTVKDLADKLDVKVKDVLKRLLERRIVVTINTTLDTQTATTIAREFGADVKMQTFEEEMLQAESEHVRPEDLSTRAPVVTVMGHVDHGKTTLLDAIRETRVAEREAGGITQHIGAYRIGINTRNVVFLDTPGHEAFTMMRARGAKVTDVVVLVVAADDGVMPQTREAIDHARAANVPILVAVNKVDKPDANPDRVKRELADLGLMPEDWGGQTVMVPVSALKRQNLELLLEMILLVSDLLELKANPSRAATGTVLEAKLDRGRGPVATVLVQEGTLRVGDTVIAGTAVGKVRALIDDRGRHVKQAGPATPVEVLGLGEVPQPGDTFQQVTDAAKARQITVYRQQIARQKSLESRSRRVTLETLQQQIEEGEVKELALIIKADVQGSAEVLADTLTKLGDERVNVRVMHAGVGAINRSDVQLASASNAIVIGFNVRPDRAAVEEAERTGVDVRLHSVIYNITDEIKKAMAGLLEPTYREVKLGSAEVRQLFRVPKIGTVAGCLVVEGRLVRSAEARLLRDNVVVYEGKLGSLKRFKDDVGEVKAGLECGIAFERFNDLKPGDVIEMFTVEQIAATV